MNVLTSLKTFLAKEETAPLWASRFLEITKDWAGSTAFICEPTNPKPWLFSLTLAWGRHYSSALFIPGLGQQLETISTTQSPLEWFNPAALKLFTLPCLAFPGYGSTLSLFLTHIDASPCSCHGIHLVSSTCEYNKLCFSWVFSVLFLGLYLTDNHGEGHRTRTCSLILASLCRTLWLPRATNEHNFWQIESSRHSFVSIWGLLLNRCLETNQKYNMFRCICDCESKLRNHRLH